MPAPVFAEVNTTGIRWPSRSARSSGSCSSSGLTSPFSRYRSISFSSTSTTWSTSLRCASSTEREIGLARGREEAVRHLRAVARRQVERQALLAEGLLDALEQILQIDVVGVDLVDDDQAAEAALRRPVHEAPGHHLDAVLRVDDDRRGLDGGERRQRLAEEIRVARRVEQVDSVIL